MIIDIESTSPRIKLSPNGVNQVWTRNSDSIDIIQNLSIKFLKREFDHSLIEIKGVDTSIANAIRRILIAEVPSLAIETVMVWQNTGLIHDDVLAHRLALVPFNIYPEEIEYRGYQNLNDSNSICFELKVAHDPNNPEKYQPVYTSHLKWIPLSEQQHARLSHKSPGPLFKDILLTKLAPGQQIELKAYLEKGIGRTHSKWSIVSSATYRFYPHIDISTQLTKHESEELVDTCPMNVFSLNKEGNAVVGNPLKCTSCRACLEKFKDKVTITKSTNHFIFSIETCGPISSWDAFIRAVNILKDKGNKLKSKLMQ